MDIKRILTLADVGIIVYFAEKQNVRREVRIHVFIECILVKLAFPGFPRRLKESRE